MSVAAEDPKEEALSRIGSVARTGRRFLKRLRGLAATGRPSRSSLECSHLMNVSMTTTTTKMRRIWRNLGLLVFGASSFDHLSLRRRFRVRAKAGQRPTPDALL